MRKLTWRQIRTVTIRVGSFNVPESGKRGLIRNRVRRARRFLTVATRRLIGLGALQESGPNLQRTARPIPRWRTVFARPNSRAWGSWQANGLLIQRLWFRVLDTDQLTVDGLHQPIALVRHRRTGWKLVLIGFHAPTKRADPSQVTRRNIVAAITAYIHRLDNVPTIVCGDANDGAYGRRYGPELRVMHKNYVDFVMATEHFTAGHKQVINLPGVSDHRFPVVRLHGRWVGRQINRLP